MFQKLEFDEGFNVILVFFNSSIYLKILFKDMVFKLPHGILDLFFYGNLEFILEAGNYFVF